MPFSSTEAPGPPPVTVKAYLYWQLRAIDQSFLPTFFFFFFHSISKKIKLSETTLQEQSRANDDGKLARGWNMILPTLLKVSAKRRAHLENSSTCA